MDNDSLYNITLFMFKISPFLIFKKMLELNLPLRNMPLLWSTTQTLVLLFVCAHEIWMPRSLQAWRTRETQASQEPQRNDAFMQHMPPSRYSC